MLELADPLWFPAERRVLRYGLAATAIVVACAVRWAIDPWVGDRLPLFTAYAAVAGVAWTLGLGPGLFALVAGYVLHAYLFLTTHGTLIPRDIVEAFEVVCYGVAGVGMCVVAWWFQQQQQRARERERHADALLAEKATELARSNEDLAVFAHAIAHDLKEPVRNIRLSAALLLEDCGGTLPERERSRLEGLARASERAVSMIGSVLELSGVGRELDRRPTDLTRLLAEVVESLGTMLRETNGEVTVLPLPVVRCEPAQIARVFSNLISNALKYNTSDQKRVEISATPRGCDGWVLRVRDNGIGIPPEHRDRVFQMFKRLHGPGEFGGGTGAGLALVRRIVQRHGGRVWIAPESGPGTGLMMCFTLDRESGVETGQEAAHAESEEASPPAVRLSVRWGEGNRERSSLPY